MKGRVALGLAILVLLALPLVLSPYRLLICCRSWRMA